jgi:3-dehydroquinate synthetase
VHIGEGLLTNLGPITSSALKRQARKAYIVADARVPSASLIAAADSLKSVGISVRSCAVKPSEQEKTFAGLERILVELARARIDRDDVVIALGGGIVGDMAGFAAAILRRGVQVVQCPTTLLSMVDASVGGKTGVNLNTGEGPTVELKKNLIGAFHQPRVVVADVHVLTSLPDRALRCGLAECIKHGLLTANDPDLLGWIERNITLIISKDRGALCELVARNVAVKAAIVSDDELEEAPDGAGGRALLNLGHTFGHAIETLPGLLLSSSLSSGSVSGATSIEHGEAVALGTIAAAHCSHALGRCSTELRDRVTSLIRSAGLPTAIAGLPSDEVLIERMSHDKKVRGGTLRLILPVDRSTTASSPGAVVISNPPIQAVTAGLAAIRL